MTKPPDPAIGTATFGAGVKILQHLRTQGYDIDNDKKINELLKKHAAAAAADARRPAPAVRSPDDKSPPAAPRRSNRNRSTRDALRRNGKLG
jgi:hypothetical protein